MNCSDSAMIHLTSHKDNELRAQRRYVVCPTFFGAGSRDYDGVVDQYGQPVVFQDQQPDPEVGIRKVMGQNSGRVVSQLLIESLFAGIVSFLIALLLCQVLLPQFNLVVDKDLHLWTPVNIKLVGLSMLLMVFVSVAAIARPAARLARRPSSFLLLRDYRNVRSSTASQHAHPVCKSASPSYCWCFLSSLQSQSRFFRGQRSRLR